MRAAASATWVQGSPAGRRRRDVRASPTMRAMTRPSQRRGAVIDGAARRFVDGSSTAPRDLVDGSSTDHRPLVDDASARSSTAPGISSTTRRARGRRAVTQRLRETAFRVAAHSGWRDPMGGNLPIPLRIPDCPRRGEASQIPCTWVG
jgi:hypothetical protein